MTIFNQQISILVFAQLSWVCSEKMGRKIPFPWTNRPSIGKVCIIVIVVIIIIVVIIVIIVIIVIVIPLFYHHFDNHQSLYNHKENLR